MNIILHLILQLAWFCGVIHPQPKPPQYVTWEEVTKQLRKAGAHSFMAPCDGWLGVIDGKAVFIPKPNADRR